MTWPAAILCRSSYNATRSPATAFSAESVMDVVESVSGKTAGQVIEGQLPFPLAVLLPIEYRTSPARIADLMLATSTGSRIPLTRVADVREVRGAKYITREWSKRRITIQCNVPRPRYRQLRFCRPSAHRTAVEVPPGYRLEWGADSRICGGLSSGC